MATAVDVSLMQTWPACWMRALTTLLTTVI